MIKYAAIRVVKLNIQAGMAQLEALCRVNNTDVTYWKPTASGMRSTWALFDTIEEAEKYGDIATPVIPYGVQCDE